MAAVYSNENFPLPAASYALIGGNAVDALNGQHENLYSRGRVAGIIPQVPSLSPAAGYRPGADGPRLAPHPTLGYHPAHLYCRAAQEGTRV